MKRSEASSFAKSAKEALKKHFPGPITPDSRGYLRSPTENLLPGIRFDDIESDLRAGAGNELRTKFSAVHSSAALAVNSFGYFKTRPLQLRILGLDAFQPPLFERQCPTGLGGTPPNLDAWLVAPCHVVAVESKFLEYFTPKEAKYSRSYTRSSVTAEDCWWSVVEDSRSRGRRYLDVAQLVKHYFGLRRFLNDSPEYRVTLLYVYWEPSNADEIAVCREHRREISRLADQVADSQIPFAAMPYPTLWNQWRESPELKIHVENLFGRYGVAI